MRPFVLSLGILLCAAAPALGSASRPVSFSGSCELSGAVAFRPALTNAPQDVTQRARATGTCTGSFTDARGREHDLAAAPVAYAATSQSASGSCLGGLAAGRGTLRFKFGRLRFRLSETRVGATPLLQLDGARSGSAHALVTPSPDQDAVAALQACAGAGLAEFLLDARLQTTPRVSG